MKNAIALVLLLCILVSACIIPALAVDQGRSYDFRLTVDDKTEKEAETGQIITATLLLKRCDSDLPSLIHAVQAELEYDESFLELVDSSVITGKGLSWTDIARRTGGRAFYVNYLSLSGGESWESETVLAVFQFRVLGVKGVSTIHAVNCLVSTENGEDAFASVCNDVRIVVSTDCYVSFEENGGSDVADQLVQYGEKLQKPRDPKRKGYTFEGWYKDMDRTERWDFDTDVVRGNMTLYANWTEGETGGTTFFGAVAAALLLPLLIVIFLLNRKKVSFDSRGGSRVKAVWVRKGSLLSAPATPVKAGCSFNGWYQDEGRTIPWMFKTDKVEASMILYADWKY